MTWVISVQANTNERSLSGNLGVWIFLGLCALIVISQIAPMLWQMKKQSRQVAEQSKLPNQQQVH
jgi:hypothetical protein